MSYNLQDIFCLWALEWVWHPVETNLRTARSSKICQIPNVKLLQFPRYLLSYGRTNRWT